MATMVCRGLQSCLDSHIVEQRTMMLMKLSSPTPRSHFSHPFEFPLNSPFTTDYVEETPISDECDNFQQLSAANNGGSAGGWIWMNSLQFQGLSKSEKEEIYVHPLSKRSNSPSLSEKSLELCTENLGNETGSDIIENNIFSPEEEMGGGNFQRKEKKMKSQSHQSFGGKKMNNSQKFPPPLTTIRRESEQCFRVKPHREEGRLIIEAVKTPARQSCFQAERSHGRLRLCFSKTEDDNDDEDEEEDEEEEEEEDGIL